MVETRKRKSALTSAKAKKAKAAEEKSKESPTKDEHAAAAEALKALRKGDGGDVDVVVKETVAAEDGDGKANEAAVEDVVQSKVEPTEDSGPSEEVASSEPKGEEKSEGGAEAADESGDKANEPVAENVADTKENPTDDPSPSEETKPSESKVETPAEQPKADSSDKPQTTSHAPSSSQPASDPNANAFVEDAAEVPPLYVGRIIGKGGEMIRDLEARSGCKIDVNQTVTPKIITYRGTRSEIDFAKQLVSMLCTEKGDGAKLPLGRATLKVVQVPGSVIGKIIGRKGEMIRKLQNESRAKIEVDHSGAGMGVDNRQVTITGTNDAVIKAEEMVNFLGANPAVDGMEALTMLMRDKSQSGKLWGSGPPYPNFPNQGQGMPANCAQNMGMNNYNQGYGQPPVANQYQGQNYNAPGGGGGSMGVEAEVWPCAKIHMGRVIGQRGITVNDLQKRSGCDIQINQNVPAGQDCQITIKGARQGIEMVKQMLQEIIDLGHNHPYAGGHGAPAGGGGYGQQQGGWGQPQGQPVYHQQQAPYQQNAYGNPGYQNQGYPQQQQYGGPPNQYGAQQPMHQMPQQPYPQQGQPYGAPMQPPVQASPWRAAQAADGQTYYFNEITRQTQWERPAGFQ